jgi:prepilin-type N-terminal cleavage/methylation domain-containing protein
MFNKIIKKINFYSDRRGYTLVEILLVVSIFVMLTFMGADYIVNGFKSTTFNSEQEEAIGNARNAVDVFTREVRGANNSNAGAYTIKTINPQEFIFYSDINDDNLFEKIRYYLSASGTEFMRDVIAPGPYPYSYHQATSTSIIARYVNNNTEPLFFYFDGNGATSTTINNIRMIGISIKVNVTPSRAPNDYYVVTDATIRNLKSNL